MVRVLSDDLQAFKFTEGGTEYLLTNVWFKKTKILCLQKSTVPSTELPHSFRGVWHS